MDDEDKEKLNAFYEIHLSLIVAFGQLSNLYMDSFGIEK